MKITKLKIKNCRRGYAVLELLFYIALFAVLSLVVIDAMIVMARSFKETTLQAELMQGGTMVERISREIRQAYDIDVASTSIDLKLNTTGVNTAVEFKLVGSDIQFLENGAVTGNLNSSSIVITGLTFTQITTVKGKAVKLFLTIQSSNDISNRTQDFYDTVVLRGIY
ncbi:MAG: hypothetical protein UU82_C0039G0009 [Candidatus Nomurabacteria bacterium GW2011_GWC2_41_8]|uniref:Uncharacterized protein n=3 Tax=Candidatus Nomuraibacteriota TaxID=1752729 RepID=A0A1F6YA70_9BACT|nr:MAG: hypothetical protein UU58_C0002G0004 [Candidatus Nomurabacteria bacterium GW2011_GWA2_41_25]KKS23146.1 MAG: hypothetical protein UU82_C0039G0009 [Candidatus Nomurabacteria bacterium GW2011_GWC2_41_8]OGI66743.1 MAG: hypothetical protein A2823_00555 [Candidatus Nomurabacteria bacterium RIFCSPHIGHO2_01_FULL_41_91]OGI80936.1 MAG: hypothetical protein A3D43_01755 [Candidatus Nomurabacteria bacterium RIFCSPHIGHO2_02_FULL_41_52]OGI84506.1 MAG: hypothetical protein A3F49_02850 [Candidatus Nomur